MPGSEISTGVAERLLYGAIIAATSQLVKNGYMDSDMQAYVAGGGVAAIGAAWAWWQNRPGRLMDRAASQMPADAKLAITIGQDASRQDKDAIHDLARAAGENVIAKVTV